MRLFTVLAFLAVCSLGAGLFDLRLRADMTETIGYIYIDEVDLANQLVLAEPHTLGSLSSANITVRTNVMPIHFDLVFAWTVYPADNEQFMLTEGFGVISRMSDSTRITVQVKDTRVTQLERETYYFNLDRVTTNFVNSTWRYFVRSTADTVPITLLPTGFPFGYFEFDVATPTNISVSRYTKVSPTDALLVRRKFGLANRILVAYEESEVAGTSIFTSTKYLEFFAGESLKAINFSSTFKRESLFNSALYPRKFIVKLASAYILDQVSEVRVEDPLVINATDILPRIGPRSVVYVTVIDDKAIIEFVESSTDVIGSSVHLASNRTATLTLERSTTSSLAQRIVVNFLTVPLYPEDVEGAWYQPARPYKDYSPVHGQVVFASGSKLANLTFSIFQNDEFYALNINRHFRVDLISIENCQTCKFGANSRASVRIEALRTPFLGLLALNDSIANNTIYLNLPSYLTSDQVLLPASTSVSAQTLVCATSKRGDVPFRIKYELVLLSSPPMFLDQLKVSIDGLNPTDPFYSNRTVVFNATTPPSSCMRFQVTVTSAVNAYRCYNLTYRLNIYTSYAINQALELYSDTVSLDSYTVRVVNRICTEILVENYFLLANNITTFQTLLNNSTAQYADNSVAFVSANLAESIQRAGNEPLRVAIPLIIRNNMASQETFKLRYRFDVDPRLSSYLVVNAPSVGGFVTATLAGNSTANTIIFDLIQMANFPYYLFNLNLTIYGDPRGAYQIGNSQWKSFNSDQLSIDQSVFALKYSFEFVTKTLTLGQTCGLVRFSRRQVRFASINNQRQLILAFVNEFLNPDCVIELLYNVNMTSSPVVPGRSSRIYDYISNVAENFYFIFPASESRNQKGVLVNNNVYLDVDDKFQVSVAALSAARPLLKTYLQSVADDVISVMPSAQVANGGGAVSARINNYLNQSSLSPYETSNYELSFSVDFYRMGSFGKAVASYQLLLIDPVLSQSVQYDYVSIDGPPQVLENMVLNQDEMNKTFHVDLKSIVNNRIFADLLLLGSICYFDQADLRIACSRKNDQVLVEPDGVFMFNASSASQLVSYADKSISLNGAVAGNSQNDSALNLNFFVERYFGSRSLVNINFALASSNAFVDLYFPDYQTSGLGFVSFPPTVFLRSIKLILNTIHSSFQRDFYIYLMNAQVFSGSSVFSNSTIYETDKIYRNSSIAKLTVEPQANYLNVLAFNERYVMVPITYSFTNLTVSLIISRIGMPANSSGQAALQCSVKTAGYRDFVPAYIDSIERAQNKSTISYFQLAYPNLEFSVIDSVVTFASNQSSYNLSFSVFSNFSSELDDNMEIVSKIFYIYLSEPKNGARLIEPSSQYPYSPYIKVELRKIPFDLMNFNPETVVVGFYQDPSVNHTNQTLYLDTIVRPSTTNIFEFVYQLLANRYITNNPSVDGLYQVEWTAEIVQVSLNATRPGSPVSLRNIMKCAYYDHYYSNDSQLSSQIETVRCRDYSSCSTRQKNCSLPIPFRTDDRLYNDCLLKITLHPASQTSFYQTKFLNVQIDNSSRVAFLYLKANSVFPSSVQFDSYSLLSFNNKMKLSAELRVLRSGLVNQTSRVYYSTKEFTEEIYFDLNGITFYSANAGYDFEPASGYVTFLPGQTEQTIAVNLRALLVLNNQVGPGLSPIYLTSSGDNTASLYPRMFQVVLKDCSPDCGVATNSSTANVTILAETTNLWRVYRQVLVGDLQVNLDEILALSQQGTTLSSVDLNLVIQTLQQSISQQSSLMLDSVLNSQINTTALKIRRHTMLFTLCNFLSSKRTDLDGNIKFMSLLEDLIFTDLMATPTCVSNASYSNLTLAQFSCPFAAFNYACLRVNASTINQTFYTSESYQIKIPLTTQNPLYAATPCFDICVIELLTSTTWIPDFPTLLNNQAVSLSIRPSQLIGSNGVPVINASTALTTYVNLTNPIAIQMRFPRAIQTSRVCAIYDADLDEWNSDLCSTTKVSTTILCQCYHHSIYGIRTQLDSLYYGYNDTWFYLVTSFKIMAILTAILTHIFCLRYYSFEACCVMQMLASNAFAQLLYLITIAVSPSVIVQEPLENNDSCIALSLFFHYFILSQFTWIFVCALVFYLQLLLGCKSTFIFQLSMTVTAWLIPVLVIGIFYLITGLVYEYAYNYSAAFIYTDVMDNSQVCFIKNIWAFFGGLIVPCFFFLFLGLVFFLLLFSNSNRWGSFDDIYEGRANAREIFWIFGLWCLIVTVNVWAGLHLRYGYLWLFILFCIFDFLLAFYVLLFYTFARHLLTVVELKSSYHFPPKAIEPIDANTTLPSINKSLSHHRYQDYAISNLAPQPDNQTKPLRSGTMSNNLHNYSPYAVASASAFMTHPKIDQLTGDRVNDVKPRDAAGRDAKGVNKGRNQEVIHVRSNSDDDLNDSNANNKKYNKIPSRSVNEAAADDTKIFMISSSDNKNSNQKSNSGTNGLGNRRILASDVADHVKTTRELTNHQHAMPPSSSGERFDNQDLRDLNFLLSAGNAFMNEDHHHHHHERRNDANGNLRKLASFSSTRRKLNDSGTRANHDVSLVSTDSSDALSTSGSSVSTSSLISANWLYQSRLEPNRAFYYQTDDRSVKSQPPDARAAAQEGRYLRGLSNKADEKAE